MTVSKEDFKKTMEDDYSATVLGIRTEQDEDKKWELRSHLKHTEQTMIELYGMEYVNKIRVQNGLDPYRTV